MCGEDLSDAIPRLEPLTLAGLNVLDLWLGLRSSLYCLSSSRTSNCLSIGSLIDNLTTESQGKR